MSDATRSPKVNVSDELRERWIAALNRQLSTDAPRPARAFATGVMKHLIRGRSYAQISRMETVRGLR